MTKTEQQDKYKKFLNTDFTVFDLETSGLDPVKDEILEIVAIKMRGEEIIDRFESLVRPTKAITREVEKIHGLNEVYLLVNGRDLGEVLADFTSFIGESIVVGHNIREFDWLFILNSLKRLTKPVLNNKIIDTLELSRKLLSLPRYNLSTVSQNFGYEHKDAHRAMPDTEINAKVFIELMKLLLTKNKE